MTQKNSGASGTAVVTGASSGLGKVYADRLAGRGYNLLLVARREDRLKAIAEDLESRFPVSVTTLVADLADADALARVVARIAGDATITLLVNNAGTSIMAPLTDASSDRWTQMIALNITALTALARAVLPGFAQRGSGTMINVGSVTGFIGYSWVPIYGATKAYVLNFTQALQHEYANTGIRVQLVAPGATMSEIWEVSGFNLAELDPATVMTAEHCVDAALRGLDAGERITAPSMHDDAALRNFEEASRTLFRATRHGQPAPRYGLGEDCAES